MLPNQNELPPLPPPSEITIDTTDDTGIENIEKMINEQKSNKPDGIELLIADIEPQKNKEEEKEEGDKKTIKLN